MPIRLCVLFGLVLGWTYSLPADVLYSVTDLGTFHGNAINNNGQVTGTSNGHTFLYSNGQTQDLGTLGGCCSVGYGINNNGQVTGYAFIPTNYAHAFFYSNGQMMDLGTLGGSSGSVGTGINDAGQVTGYSSLSPAVEHAFLYTNGHMTDLGTLGGDNSQATAINNAGQIIGYSNTSTGAVRTFLYSNGQMMDIGVFSANGINNVGQITGASNEHALLYSNGQTIDLGTLPGYPFSTGNSINDAGQVVGCAMQRGVENSKPCVAALLYSNGTILNLNTATDPALGITLTEAVAINDQGQIVASNYAGQSYLLTPIPEPSTLALFGVALLLLCILRRFQVGFLILFTSCMRGS